MKGGYCQLWRTGYLIQPWSEAANGIAPCDLTCVLGEKKKGTYGNMMKVSIIANIASCVTMTLEMLSMSAFRCLSPSLVGRIT